jgi:hypothetical protein
LRKGRGAGGRTDGRLALAFRLEASVDAATDVSAVSFDFGRSRSTSVAGAGERLHGRQEVVEHSPTG